MDIAIIGGGFTGLTAAYELTKKGHRVVVFERDKELGGLAQGWKEKKWAWHLEFAYHHLFTNDYAILHLVKELGIGDTLIIKRPVTANIHGDNFYQLDSPSHLLRFPLLSPLDKVRTGFLLAFLKLNPYWKPLESVTAQDLFTTIGGTHAWDLLWSPLMTGKFSDYAPTISAAWLWARIKKRTPKLVYIRGGFHTLLHTLTNTIALQGGIIRKGTTVTSVTRDAKTKRVTISFDGKKETFDRVPLTVPTAIAAKLVQFPKSFITPLLAIPHLHAQVLVLETKQPILKDIYWLNITNRSFPFLAVVAHTNFMDKKHYGNHHLTYVGNYLPQGHPFITMTKEELLKKFLPYIKRLSSHSTIEMKNLKSYLFTGPFAQPVHQVGYSKLAPTMTTPITGIYLANMDSIYPWDRGTNYAVELGQKAAETIKKT